MTNPNPHTTSPEWMGTGNSKAARLNNRTAFSV